MNKVFLSASTQDQNIGFDKIDEEQRMFQLANSIYNFSSKKQYIRQNSQDDNLSSTIVKSNNFKPKFHLSLHSNSCGKYHQNYNEASTDIYYYYKSSESEKMAKKLESIFNFLMPHRKIIVRPDSWLYPGFGLAETRETTGIAILVENFWHCNQKDIEFYKNNINLFKDVYYKFIWVLITKGI